MTKIEQNDRRLFDPRRKVVSFKLRNNNKKEYKIFEVRKTRNYFKVLEQILLESA